MLSKLGEVGQGPAITEDSVEAHVSLGASINDVRTEGGGGLAQKKM